jgi:hypothetical protein
MPFLSDRQLNSTPGPHGQILAHQQSASQYP